MGGGGRHAGRAVARGVAGTPRPVPSRVARAAGSAGGWARRALLRPRRPAAEPPLLAHGLGRTARPWLVALAFTVVWVWLPGLGAGAWVDEVDEAVLGWSDGRFAALREGVPVLSASRVFRAGGWLVVAALALTRQWRRLAVFVGVVQLALLTTMAETLAHPRPYGAAYLARVGGDALPSWPVAGLAVLTVATPYAVIPSGRLRRRALGVSAGAVVLFAVARVALGYDRTSAALVGAVFGASLAVVGFDVLAPDDVFPVRASWTPAHLDIDARRGAIARALMEQAGLRLTDLRPFNLAGSAGSTPMLLTLAEPGPPRLFAKLYSTAHLRSDRAFKLLRAIRYGALEDEAPFANVRSLVQHEDYLLRVLRDAGVRVPGPLGVVEVVPEREYMVVTEFVADATELGDATVDDFVMDDALAQVRTMWRAGVAHRDVKPSNVLVRDGRVWFIDVGFGEVRPSRWRRSVDLANTMLVLALRSDARRVLDRALLRFGVADVAAAFAATHAVTIPSQLRAMLRDDGRDLLAEFRALLPPAPRVRVQRWTPRRLAITATTALTLAAGAGLGWVNLHATGWL